MSFEEKYKLAEEKRGTSERKGERGKIKGF
jgi:hypothetical protein